MGLLSYLRPRGTRSVVTMTSSVDEFVAGHTYTLPVDLADRFIVRGYAEGTLSRRYSDDEILAMTINNQAVTFSG